MEFNTNNLLCFHLNLFNNIEQVEKMIQDRGLLDLDAQTIWNSKMNGRLKLWIDKDTHEIIFWTEKGNQKGTICINANYLSTIHNMKSVCYDRKVKVTESKKDSNREVTYNMSTSEMNQTILNIILDKISSKGIDSLNNKEKDFLSKYSD